MKETSFSRNKNKREGFVMFWFMRPWWNNPSLGPGGGAGACMAPEVGYLIGAYELGLLLRESRERFERHLLECNYCFGDLYEMDPIVKYIKGG
jgi:hypothetical protein